VDGAACAFVLGAAIPAFGAALTVLLPAPLAKGAACAVAVAYATASDSSALQWLPPAQTAGRTKPYLFSQCQAIHARSMLPCVDSPGKALRSSRKVRLLRQDCAISS
jgi:leukotriene-A4 hydrolase